MEALWWNKGTTILILRSQICDWLSLKINQIGRKQTKCSQLKKSLPLSQWDHFHSGITGVTIQDKPTFFCHFKLSGDIWDHRMSHIFMRHHTLSDRFRRPDRNPNQKKPLIVFRYGSFFLFFFSGTELSFRFSLTFLCAVTSQSGLFPNTAHGSEVPESPVCPVMMQLLQEKVRCPLVMQLFPESSRHPL